MVQPEFRTFDIGNMCLVCIGDIHGDFPFLRFNIETYIKKYNLTNVVFVLCGDCGFFGFGENENKWLSIERFKLNTILSDSGCHLYMFRGNHDNPALFIDEYIVGDTDKLRNIHVLKDYDILQSSLYGRILIVPGAFSIDRSFRTIGFDHFQDEDVLNLTDEQLTSLGKFDMVLSHSLPYYSEQSNNESFLNPFRRHDSILFTSDGNTFDDKMNSQEETLKNIQSHVCAKRWISGHYHKSKEYCVGDTRYIAIDVKEFYNVM